MARLLLAVAVALFFLGVGAMKATGPKYSSFEEEAAAFAALESNQYIELLGEAYVHDWKNDALASLIGYYKQAYPHVRSTVRDTTKGAAVDCVPFEKQPSLIDKPKEELEMARKLYVQAMQTRCPPSLIGTEECAAQQVGATRSVCPDDLVAIARPIVAYRGAAYPALVKPHPKSLPPSDKNSTVPPGYSYVDSAFVNTTNATWTYTILGVGAKVNAPQPSVPYMNFDDHSINQMWWVETPPNPNVTLKTLEAGWIHCAYWTFFPTTTLFAFSTPDGYQDTPQNQYNTQGGFIMYPGAPPLAVGMPEIQYMFRYEVLPNNTGFSLYLKPFKESTLGIYYVFEDWVPLGYWPISHYDNNTAPQFNVLQTGQELARSAPSQNLTAGGKIFGWGTSNTRLPILGNFTNYGHNISFGYGNFPIFSENRYSGKNFVHFFGPEH